MGNIRWEPTDPKWGNDEAYIARRQEFALMPGAWECASAARLRIPIADPGGSFGRPDTIRYEGVAVPTLIIAGAEDPIVPAASAVMFSASFRDANAAVVPDAAHLMNVEQPDIINRLVLDHLSMREGV